MSLGGYEKAFAGKRLPSNVDYDLVAVMGGEPAAMFDMGIQALGGMGAFVKKGQKVLVKPNIGWDVVPEKGGNTNPLLVKRIIEHCYRAGAKEVYVFDNTCDNWIKCYKNSGIEQAVKDAGAKIEEVDRGIRVQFLGDRPSMSFEPTPDGVEQTVREHVHVGVDHQGIL